MTYYGLDLYGRPRLADLLASSSRSKGSTGCGSSTAIRSFSPMSSTTFWAGLEKIIPYLDMPLQHINDRMLKMMNRRHTSGERGDHRPAAGDNPGARPADDVHRGFPRRNRGRIRRAGRIRRGDEVRASRCFPLLVRARHAGGQAPRSLPEAVTLERRDRVMAAQQPIAFAFNQKPGRQNARRLDRHAGARKEATCGWAGSYADAPDVDGSPGCEGTELQTGDLVSCEIVAAEEL